MTSQFIWYELITVDPDAAADFYGAVVGWRATDSGQAGMDYRILTMNDVGVGGLLPMPPDAAASGLQPGWVGYVSVADVDASVAGIIAAGGRPCMPATDIPGVGRMAMVTDPQGAAFYVMTPMGDGPATSFAPGKPGHGGWHELHTSDSEAAWAFYSAQFGWKVVDAMDMGPMGSYLRFNIGSGTPVGGMFNDAGTDRPHWLYYFNVDDIDAAHSRVRANGGQEVGEPHAVPTGDWIVQARDPQGTAFALVGPKEAGR